MNDIDILNYMLKKYDNTKLLHVLLMCLEITKESIVEEIEKNYLCDIDGNYLESHSYSYIHTNFKDDDEKYVSNK